MKCIKMLTFLSLDEIAAMETWDDSRINEKKEVLAYELTQLVHGKDEADKAKETSRNLFSGGGNSADMPTTEIEASALTDGKIGILDLMVAGKLAPSRSEAKRLVIQGGVAMNEEKVAAFNATVAEELLKEGVVIRKGKKVYHKFILK
jgi:tyrosyl-tRNA synthetase